MYQYCKNARVCVFGDSITHNGAFIRTVYEYYLENLGIACEFYNCGVSGNSAAQGFMRLSDLITTYNPTDIVIFFGMNDIGYELYDGRAVTEEVVRQRRMRADTGIANLKEIADIISTKDIKMIFCTPTPYDDISDKKEYNHFGVSAVLKELGDRVTLLANHYGSHVVDFFSDFYNAMKSNYRTGQTLHRDDRVHPNGEGQELMAQIFLKSQGFPIELHNDFESLYRIVNRKHSEWENERYELEQVSKEADFIVYSACSGITDPAQIKHHAVALLNNSNPYIVNCARTYLDKYDELVLQKLELINHTKTVYKRLEGE